MIKQLLVALLMGLFMTLFFAQFDTWVHHRITTFMLTVFEKSFHCNVTGTVESCSLLPLTVRMKDVTFSSVQKDAEWSWHAATFAMEFSWYSFCMGQPINTAITIDNLEAYSGVADGKLAIFPHLRDLIRGPTSSPVPIILKAVQMRQASVIISNGALSHFYWNGESRRIGRQFCSQFYVYDGSITAGETVLVKNIAGSVGIETIEQQHTIIPTIRVEGRGELPQLGIHPLCFVTGRWFDRQGRFQIQSIDNNLLINPLIVAERDNRFYVDATMTAPLTYLSNVGGLSDTSVQGTARLRLRGDAYAEGNGECQFTCDEMTHPLVTAMVRSNIKKRGMEFEGTTEIKGSTHAWQADFKWNGYTQKGTAKVINTMPCSIAWQPWIIKPRALALQLTYDTSTYSGEGVVTGTVFHKTKDTPLAIAAQGLLDPNHHLTGKIMVGDYQGILDAWYDGMPRIDYVKLLGKKGEQLIDCYYDRNQNRYTGHVDFALLRLWCNAFFHYDIHGEGTLLFTAWRQQYTFFADMQLKDATVRLPQTLNFMQDCTASGHIDFATRSVVLQEVHGALHTGTFYIPRAIMQLDAHSAVTFFHVPLLIDHCLFTVKRDLFAMVSGSLLLQKRYSSDAQLTGHVILERSQLKENLFSGSVQKKLLQFSDVAKIMPPLPLLCDLNIETKEPIRVDTPFLEANAQLSLQVQHYLKQPKLAGFITVSSGSIRFPYKPLQLTKGEIIFLPEQSLNPLIEIVAKNNIKNHNITLQVTGSLQDHMVLLESTPPLTEEQIVGLLLAGAHEDSLQALIPALLMQNVTNYIFSSHRSNFFEQYIKPWMRKINVQLKPNFNEQSGRGGLRGALEIIVNERWRALIEKNFTLTEDTRFELEYILSDDITFRLVRDERCDIGAEVEMKWKF